MSSSSLVSLCVETLRGLDTHSSPCPTTLQTPPLAVVPGCLASCFIFTSVEKPHRCASMCVSVCVCLTEIDTHRIMCIYIWSSHQGLCSTPLLFPPPWVNHLHFHFYFFDWNETVGLQDGKGGGALSKITSNSAPTLLQSRRGCGPGLCLNFCPPPPNIFLTLCFWVKRNVPYPTSIPSHPYPKKTAGIGPFGAVLLLRSVCGWSDELGTLWEWEGRRGTEKNEGGSVYRKMVT